MNRFGLNKEAIRRVNSQGGLTLVEIIVVLIILSVLFGFLFSGLFGQADTAKARTTGLMMTKLKSSINQFQLQYNQLPASLQALRQCTEQTGQACIPIINNDDELKDAWGTPFVYANDGARGYTIKSLGSDKREGGSEANSDIVVSGP